MKFYELKYRNTNNRTLKDIFYLSDSRLANNILINIWPKNH